MMYRFGMITREVAQVARVSPAQIHAELHRRGHWRGVRPGRQVNGRLLWPREAVYRVTGGVPDRDDMHQGELAVCRLLDDAGVEIDSGGWAAIQVLLAKPDRGRCPSLVLDELGALVWLTVAFTDRLDAAWPALSEEQRAQAAKSLRYAGSLLNGFNNDNKNEAT